MLSASNTPRKNKFIKYQRAIQRYFISKGYGVMETTSESAPFDILLSKSSDKGNLLCGIGEIKCRELAGINPVTIEYLSKNGGLLICNTKMEKNKTYSKVFGCPYFVISYLLQDELLLIWKVTDEYGDQLLNYEVKTTTTKFDCNGGSKTQENAFLPMITPLLTERHLSIDPDLFL